MEPIDWNLDGPSNQENPNETSMPIEEDDNFDSSPKND